MAMELQSHMLAYIRPSIEAAVVGNRSLLVQWFCDVKWDEDTGDAGYNLLSVLANGAPECELVETIEAAAVEYAAVTNDFGEFYIDGFTSIPWCLETLETAGKESAEQSWL